MSAVGLFLRASILSATLLWSGSCVVENTAHCYYKSAGFCAASYPGRTYCSVCLADFDGCVEAPPAAGCAVMTSATGSTDEPMSSTGTSSEATTNETTTSSTTGGATTAPTTADATTADAPTEASTTEDATTADSTTEEPTTEEPTGEAVCGDGVIEPPEICDGAALNGATCAQKDPWGGGELKCSANCLSLDYTGCCLGAGTKCMAVNDKCCPGLKCKVDGLLSYSCQL